MPPDDDDELAPVEAPLTLAELVRHAALCELEAVRFELLRSDATRADLLRAVEGAIGRVEALVVLDRPRRFHGQRRT